MATKNYYKILGVDEKATPSQMKSAYRKLALKYHPDRVPEAEKTQAAEKFKEIAAAYYPDCDAKSPEPWPLLKTSAPSL